MPPAEVTQTIPVTRIIEPREPELFEHARIYDFGQSFSGWARLTVSGPRGAKVRLHFFSRIDPLDDTPDDRSNNSAVWEARQTDTYVLKGAGRELWEPHFTLHGFRYVEVRTSGDDVSIFKLEGRFVRSAVESTGAFVGSNDLLNKIHHNIKWTLMTSFQGIPQDAFERGERVAYLGDVGFVADDYLYNFDMVGFWEKWLDDIQDTQNTAGSIPIVAPAHLGISQTDPLWPSFQSAYPMLLWSLYEYYGDKVVLERHYDSLKKLLDFMNASAQDDLTAAEPLGDHMEPQPDGFSSFAARHTPQALTANAYYYYCVNTTARIAEVLGRSEDAKAEGARAQRILAAFNRRFFNANTNEYGSGSQTSNALPLYLNMVASDKIPNVMKNLIDDIVTKQGTHVSTGIVGSNALAQALPRFGGGGVMYNLANQTTYPSLGEQVVKGATAVCESYECGPWLSQNMKMFTSLDKFFYRNLGGIEVTSPGYRRVSIKPLTLGDLRSVKVSQRTVRGDITVEWKHDVAKFDLDVTIPAGAVADIAIPNLGIRDPQIMEGTQTIWHAGTYQSGVRGLTGAVTEPDSIVFRVGSGSYHFSVRDPVESGLNASWIQ
jgi:alpha-L-rhamnosidase